MDVAPNSPKYVCARNHCDLSVPAEVARRLLCHPSFKDYSGNQVIIGKILENMDVLIHSRELEHVLAFGEIGLGFCCCLALEVLIGS
jgi:hypothetical protein